jgi:hypothetical protein
VARQNRDDSALFAYCTESEEKLRDELAQRATERMLTTAPVLVPTRRVPLPGEHWSMPGRLKGSLRVEYGTGDTGHAEATFYADRVLRFADKIRHAIRNFVRNAVVSLIGERVP